MSTAPLATVSCRTLSDALDEALAAALAGCEGERCLWCGAPTTTVSTADIWSGQVTLVCASCGSELGGVVPRQLREVRR
jgi:hypothetical protein